MNFTQAVSYHLQHNHYPPVPDSMIPVCIQALECAVHSDVYELIELPAGVLYKGSTNAPAWAICEDHHMYDFLAACDTCGSTYIHTDANWNCCGSCADDTQEDNA